MDLTPSDTTGTIGVNLYDYLNQGYFSKDSLLCTTQAHSSNFGMAGNPIPYSVRNDNTVTFILLICFCLIIILGTRLNKYISWQLKFFFSAPRKSTTSETSTEIRILMVFVAMLCLLLGIDSYILTIEKITTSFIIDSNALVVFLLSALFIGYFCAKWLIQILVGMVFFGGKKTIHYMKAQLFIMVCSCILLYPLVMLQVYFDLSLEKAAILFCFVLFLNKILAFYKSWLIFFKQKGLYFQNILYFCALEVTPLLAFCGVWLMIVNILKVNF